MTSRRQESVILVTSFFCRAHAAFAGDRVFMEKRANRTEKYESESRKCLACGYLKINTCFSRKNSALQILPVSCWNDGFLENCSIY